MFKKMLTWMLNLRTNHQKPDSHDCHYVFHRSFLTELSNIVNNTADDTVTELLQRYNADQLQIPDDELWAVEAPVIPEPEPEPGMLKYFFFLKIAKLCNQQNR